MFFKWPNSLSNQIFFSIVLSLSSSTDFTELLHGQPNLTQLKTSDLMETSCVTQPNVVHQN